MIARLSMERIQPGHFAQLPPSVQQRADVALYEPVTDPTSRELASHFAHWLSDKSLLKLLRSNEAKDRSIAVQVATGDGQWSQEVEAELIRILMAEDEQVSTRQKAARGLGRSERFSAEAKAALLKVLKASPPYVPGGVDHDTAQNVKLRSLSETAGAALAAAGPSIMDELLPMLTPLDDHLRPGALRALSGLGAASVPRLIELLGHEDEAIAISASIALSRIGKPAVPALIEALQSDNQQVVQRALSALEGMGPAADDAVARLQAIISDKDQTARVRVAAALAAYKIDRQNEQRQQHLSKALPAWTAIFEGENSLHQLWAAQVLGPVGADAEPMLPLLRAFVEKPEAGLSRKQLEAKRAAERAILMIEHASAQRG